MTSYVSTMTPEEIVRATLAAAANAIDDVVGNREQETRPHDAYQQGGIDGLKSAKHIVYSLDPADIIKGMQ